MYVKNNLVRKAMNHQSNIEQFGFVNAHHHILDKSNHLYFHASSEPPLFKGDSRDVKNKKRLNLTFIFV